MSRAKKSFAKNAAQPEFEIFCDMDGVLSDFDSHAKAQGKFNEKGQPKWEELDETWWKTMPAFKAAHAFYGGLRKLGRTRLLSAPILNVGCFRGKAEWVKNFRGSRFGLLDLILARAEDKNLLARPHHILVDDRQKNIDQWIAAGGIGILHKGDYADTLKRIEEAQAEYRRNPPKAFVAQAGCEGVEIFIGTNGVLADFASHAAAEGKFTAGGKTKWEELDTAWWKSMPAFDGAREFYDAARALGPTRFLTGPVPHPDSFEGEAEWTLKFRPESKKFALLDIIICRSKDKNLLARPGKILIDDRQENVDAWAAAGGIGILHRGDFADTLKRLTDAVADFNRAHPEAVPAKATPSRPKPK